MPDEPAYGAELARRELQVLDAAVRCASVMGPSIVDRNFIFTPLICKVLTYIDAKCFACCAEHVDVEMKSFEDRDAAVDSPIFT